MSLFLFLLVSGIGCDFCLWLFLDLSVYLFFVPGYFLPKAQNASYVTIHSYSASSRSEKKTTTNISRRLDDCKINEVVCKECFFQDNLKCQLRQKACICILKHIFCMGFYIKVNKITNEYLNIILYRKLHKYNPSNCTKRNCTIMVYTYEKERTTKMEIIHDVHKATLLT